MKIDHHYSAEELWRAYLGYLSPDERAPIWGHIESGCSFCRQVAFEMLDELLGEPPEPVEELVSEAASSLRSPVDEVDPYDRAIDLALESALRKVAQVRKERSKIPQALDHLARRGGEEFGREAPTRFRGLAGIEALLQTSWELRYKDPHEMVFLANLASAWAQRLDPEKYGDGFVREIQCRTLIELGNAFRVSDDLDAAQKILDSAARLIADGTGDEILEARLCDVQASLHAARRFFAPSCDALDTVHAIYLRRGDHHLAGRALISKGIYTGYAGNIVEAEKLIRRGLELIDPQRELSLTTLALHNLLYLLVELGRFREARTLLFQKRPQYILGAGKTSLLKLRALEGRIASGLGKHAQAEVIFREVREAFREERLGYKAALASLELAVVLREDGRETEARGIVLEAADVFLSLGVHREALAAMLVLRKACEHGVATSALLQSTLQFLYRAENNPGLAAEQFLRL